MQKHYRFTIYSERIVKNCTKNIFHGMKYYDISNLARLKCIQNFEDRELLSFALTVVNILNKLTAVRVKFTSSLSSLF